MKLKINDTVYLQKYDVAYIMHELNDISDSVIQETFINDENGFFFMMDSLEDGLWFNNAYKKPKSIKWVMEQDWIVDFDKYAKMPLDELEALHEHLKLKLDERINKFNARDLAYRDAHFAKASRRFDDLEHRNLSLKILIKYRNGEVKFGFPDGYEEDTSVIVARAPEEKPGLFARLWAFCHGTQ